MQERIGYEDQTPMFLNGFGTAHAILVEPQMGLTVLIKGFNRPTLQRQGDDPLRTPVHPVRHQHGIGARQLCVLEADHQADFAEPGKAHGQCKGPVRFVPYGHRPVGGGRDRSYWIPGSFETSSSMSVPSNALPRFRTL